MTSTKDSILANESQSHDSYSPGPEPKDCLSQKDVRAVSRDGLCSVRASAGAMYVETVDENGKLKTLASSSLRHSNFSQAQELALAAINLYNRNPEVMRQLSGKYGSFVLQRGVVTPDVISDVLSKNINSYDEAAWYMLAKAAFCSVAENKAAAKRFEMFKNLVMTPADELPVCAIEAIRLGVYGETKAHTWVLTQYYLTNKKDLLKFKTELDSRCAEAIARLVSAYASKNDDDESFSSVTAREILDGTVKVDIVEPRALGGRAALKLWSGRSKEFRESVLDMPAKTLVALSSCNESTEESLQAAARSVSGSKRQAKKYTDAQRAFVLSEIIRLAGMACEQGWNTRNGLDGVVRPLFSCGDEYLQLFEEMGECVTENPQQAIEYFGIIENFFTASIYRSKPSEVIFDGDSSLIVKLMNDRMPKQCRFDMMRELRTVCNEGSLDKLSLPIVESVAAMVDGPGGDSLPMRWLVNMAVAENAKDEGGENGAAT